MLVEAINTQLQKQHSDVQVAVAAESLIYDYRQQSNVLLNYRLHLSIYVAGRETGDLVIEFAVEPEVDVD